TTRNRIQGIVTREDGQVVLIDTPGIHEAKSLLNRQMMKEVAAALEGIDVLGLMVDATEGTFGGRPHVDPVRLGRRKRFAGKTILALNKVDKVSKQNLLPLIEGFTKAHPFVAIVPISALKGDGCDGLLGEVLKLMPESEPYFPEDQVTDQPERFLASEI